MARCPAALEQLGRQDWVDCGSRSDAIAVISLLADTDLPTASAGRFVACADQPPPWTSLRAASRQVFGAPANTSAKVLQRTENDRLQ